MNGETEIGEEITKAIEKTEDGKDFRISFGNINSAYRIEFLTDITDPNGTSYRNTAVLSGENIEDMEASATVGVRRGIPLAKSSTAYNGATQTIDWEIKFNYNEKNIPVEEAKLTDLFNNTQKLVDGSFKVEKVTIDDNGNEANSEEVSSDKYDITPLLEEDRSGFTFKFNESIQEAYKITYQTTATERVFDQETITNTVQYGGETKEASRTIYQQILSKHHGNPNYKDKMISWIIELNKDNYEMNDVVLNDNFTNGGLKLQENTLKISHGSDELVKGVDYELDLESFKITFKNTITGMVTIQYDTEFDYEERVNQEKAYLENRVQLEWMDEANNKKDKELTATFTPDNYTRSNGFKNGSYNAATKEISWEIGFNYNLKEINEAIVEDFIGTGQNLIEDSIVVKEMLLTGDPNGVDFKELEENIDYTILLNPDGKAGFRDIFKEQITVPYLISYKTSLDGELIQKEYDNTATVYDANTELTKLNAKVSVKHGGEFTDKSGKQNGKIIDWKININFSQSKIFNAKVIDIPTNNQKLLKESFRLYSTSVAADGTVTKAEEVSADEYDIVFPLTDDGDETFELIYKQDIEKPYILEYQSLILAKVGDFISNGVILTGDF